MPYVKNCYNCYSGWTSWHLVMFIDKSFVHVLNALLLFNGEGTMHNRKLHWYFIRFRQFWILIPVFGSEVQVNRFYCVLWVLEKVNKIIWNLDNNMFCWNNCKGGLIMGQEGLPNYYRKRAIPRQLVLKWNAVIMINLRANSCSIYMKGVNIKTV